MTKLAETLEEDVKAVVNPDIYLTPKGKELELYTDQHGLWLVKMNKGGELPAVLQSRWTSRDRVEYAVEHYITNMKPARTGDPDYEPKGIRAKKK